MLSHSENENLQLRDPLLSPNERLFDNRAAEGVDQELPADETTPTGTSFFHQTLFPDTDWKISGRVVIEGGFPVQLTKFLLLTIGGIVWLHWLVSHRQRHRDETLTVGQLWVFDLGLIVSDALIFFLVGRLWKQQGVDHLQWVGILLICNLFMEIQHYVPWLQHSLTMYEIHCTWSWQTWVYMWSCLLFCGGVAGLHFVKAWREKLLILKVVEMIFFVGFFLVPVLPSPNFHFHHWFAGWLIGMHCNFDVWWSRATMAWCHGLYINGIAVYGRDPILTCGYAYFLSWDQKCPFLECNYDDFRDDIMTFVDSSNEYSTSSRLNCSDDRYHP